MYCRRESEINFAFSDVDDFPAARNERILEAGLFIKVLNILTLQRFI